MKAFLAASRHCPFILFTYFCICMSVFNFPRAKLLAFIESKVMKAFRNFRKCFENIKNVRVTWITLQRKCGKTSYFEMVAGIWSFFIFLSLSLCWQTFGTRKLQTKIKILFSNRWEQNEKRSIRESLCMRAQTTYRISAIEWQKEREKKSVSSNIKIFVAHIEWLQRQTTANCRKLKCTWMSWTQAENERIWRRGKKMKAEIIFFSGKRKIKIVFTYSCTHSSVSS